MLYLGVDGGGTKTAFILIDDKGEITAYSVQGTCHYLQLGLDRFRKTLLTGINKICRQAGIDISDIAYSFFGLPAYGENKTDIPLLENIVAGLIGSNNFMCGNDVEAGWAGSLACRPGINIVGGTGAIGFGRDSEGNTGRASGWGYFCGDEGSAYWLGKRLLSLFGKQADGRKEKSRLYYIVKEEFDLKRDLDLINVVYEDLGKKRDQIASLAMLVYRAAREGDKQAIKLYKQAAREYGLIIRTLLQNLEFSPEKETFVSYSGGVFRAGGLILKPLKKQFKEQNIKFVHPVLKPVTGAALYALKLDKPQLDLEPIIVKLQQEEKQLEEVD